MNKSYVEGTEEVRVETTRDILVQIRLILQRFDDGALPSVVVDPPAI
jgi:hypothetical protein